MGLGVWVWVWVRVFSDGDDGILLACRCCTGCGRVLADDAYSTEVTFTKGADGSVWPL